MRLARAAGAPLALLLLAATAACGDDADTASPFADCAGLTTPPPSAAPAASPAAMTGASGPAGVAEAVVGAAVRARAASTDPAAASVTATRAAPAAATPAAATHAVLAAAAPATATPSAPAGAAQLPDLRLPCFTGGDEVALRDVRGPAVINLWASWCEPCRTELPVMQQLADKTAGRLTVAGVDVGDKKDKGASFATDAGVTMPTLFDADQRLLRALGRINLPITVFLDASGRSYVHLLPLDAPGLAEQVRKHTGVAVAG